MATSNEAPSKVEKGELVKHGGKAGALAKPEQAPDIGNALEDLGFKSDAPMEKMQSGGIAKWVDLKEFQLDPKAGQNEPVKGNGKILAGLLLGRQEIEDDKGEENHDGVKVRHFYQFRIVKECPVEYKDEDGNKVKSVAQPGEIVSLGERFSLRVLRDWCEDGGLYAVVIDR